MNQSFVLRYLLCLICLLGIAIETRSQSQNASFENDYFTFSYPANWVITETQDYGGGVLLNAPHEEHALRGFLTNPFRIQLEDQSLLNTLYFDMQGEANSIEEVLAGQYEALSYHFSSPVNGEFIGLIFVFDGDHFVNIMLSAPEADSTEINQYHEVLLEIAETYEANTKIIDEITVTLTPHLSNPQADNEVVIQELLAMGLIREPAELLVEFDEIMVEAGEILLFDTTEYRRNIVLAATIELDGSGSCGLLSHIQLSDSNEAEDYLQLALTDNIIFHFQQQPNAEMTVLLEHTGLDGPISFGLALPEHTAYHILGIIEDDVITILINGYIVAQDPWVLVWDYEAGAYGFGLIVTRPLINEVFPEPEGSCTATDVWIYALAD